MPESEHQTEEVEAVEVESDKDISSLCAVSVIESYVFHDELNNVSG